MSTSVTKYFSLFNHDSFLDILSIISWSIFFANTVIHVDSNPNNITTIMLIVFAFLFFTNTNIFANIVTAITIIAITITWSPVCTVPSGTFSGSSGSTSGCSGLGSSSYIIIFTILSCSSTATFPSLDCKSKNFTSVVCGFKSLFNFKVIVTTS